MEKIYLLPPKVSNEKALANYLSVCKENTGSTNDYEVIMNLKKAEGLSIFFFLVPLLIVENIENLYVACSVIVINWIIGLFLVCFNRRVNKIYKLFIANHHHNLKDIKS